MSDQHPEIDQERIDVEDHINNVLKEIVDEFSRGPVMVLVAFSDPLTGQRRTKQMAQGRPFENIECLGEMMANILTTTKLLEMRDGVEPRAYLEALNKTVRQILEAQVEASTIKSWKPGDGT